MISTHVYRISRTELARIASEEYLRTFWWIVAPVPLVGLGLVIFSRGPSEVLGLLMMLWPFSIPARSVLSTSKSSRLFTGGCHLEATEDEVVFIGEYSKDQKRLRYALPMENVKEVISRREILLIRLRLPGIAPIRQDAFKSPEDRQAFIQLVEDAVERRLAGG